MRKKIAFSRRALLKTAMAARLAAQSPQEQEILPGLRIVHGSVNTAVFERNGKKLAIDTGDLASLPVEWALYTHYHRDQASAAARLAASGARIAVPDREAKLFADAYGFWDSVDGILYHRYNFRPCMFTLRESLPVSRALKDGDAFEWQGLRFEAIETPGHTDGSLSYLVEIQGKRVAFTGDLIWGPGRIWEMYSLQKQIPGMRNGYVGFGGAASDVKTSLDRILERKPDLLVPSHGVVMTDPAGAVAEMKKNLDALMDNFLTTAAWRVNHPGTFPADKSPMLPALPPVEYPKWFREIAFTSKAIVAEDRSVFLFDCGNQTVVDKLAKLRAAKEIGPIETIWITHYHDDHTQGVNIGRRRFGFKVWVQRAMVDIIENPTAYNMPCLFPESIHVDRVVEDRESFEWKGFRMTAYFFPGQTLYHAGLLVEKDGFKLFLSGDSFSNWGLDDYCSENRLFLGGGVGYEKCLDLLLEVKPDIMVSSHWGPIRFSADHVQKCIALLRKREQLYGKLLPYDNANFGLDPYWIHAYPYRQQALPGSRVEIEARVMNHSAKPKKARAMLSLPEGWMGAAAGSGDVEIPPRTEGRIRLTATAPKSPSRRRHVLGISAAIDGRPMGEFAEAIIDFLV